jgi:putative FmdB family regulatory protein
MPIYAYRCDHCGFQQDVLRKLSDPPLSVCPQCGQDTFKKQVTAAGFQLKGSGWYVTDFRNPATKEGKGDAKSGDEKAGDAKAGETKSGDTAGASETAAPTPAPAPAPAPASGDSKSSTAAPPPAPPAKPSA